METLKAADLSKTVRFVTQSCDLIEADLEYGLNVTRSQNVGREFRTASGQMFETDGQKIAHLFKGGPHTFKFSKIDEIGGKNPVAERRQLLGKTIRFGRVGDLFESLHQKSSAEQRIGEDRGQIARRFLARYVFRRRLPVRNDCDSPGAGIA